MDSPVSIEKQNNLAIIKIDNPPVNALSHAVRAGIMDALKSFEQDRACEVAILICTGRTFIAGADITEFNKPPVPPTTPDTLLALGACQKPVVAVLHGNVLGGGLETALACSYRIAESNTRLGLPEVTLGLIPGASGTQMLPRLVGVESALEMITSGRPAIASSDAGRILVDELIEPGSYEQRLELAINYAQSIALNKGEVRHLSKVVLEKSVNHDQLFADWRQKMAKKKRGLMAAQACIESIENAVLLPFDEGIKRERELFQECRQSSQSGAMRHAFFAERTSAKVDNLDQSVEAGSVDSVGVIGAGTMGVGIAMCFANAGLQVTLIEMDQERVDAGLDRISQNYAQSVKRGVISDTKANDYLTAIKGSTNYEDLADVDLVVEAAFESMEVKHDIFAKLDQVCKPETILASNTSYLDLDVIAEATSRADRVVGLHFFSPAHIMKLLEIVR
ncbi:MAG: 3-hydroxyacyl-CoA dehydrogenase NAD-binding domain-containing protein, partial [Pseudomonadota bacterium]